mmetsp:Transcript_26011/g.80059  ORF Transcript_26011/g.80059 Transcript_26011/m.80059 type:complete len:209 (-) Transcript_26011:123-749(-)
MLDAEGARGRDAEVVWPCDTFEDAVDEAHGRVCERLPGDSGGVGDAVAVVGPLARGDLVVVGAALEALEADAVDVGRREVRVQTARERQRRGVVCVLDGQPHFQGGAERHRVREREATTPSPRSSRAVSVGERESSDDGLVVVERGASVAPALLAREAVEREGSLVGELGPGDWNAAADGLAAIRRGKARHPQTLLAVDFPRNERRPV